MAFERKVARTPRMLTDKGFSTVKKPAPVSKKLEKKEFIKPRVAPRKRA